MIHPKIYSCFHRATPFWYIRLAVCDDINKLYVYGDKVNVKSDKENIIGYISRILLEEYT